MALISTGKSAKVEVFLPNRDRDGALVHNHEQWVQQAVVALASTALGGGGCSVREERGYWNGRWEQTTVVYVYVQVGLNSSYQRSKLFNALERLVEPLLRAFKRETNQEAVALTVDGQWYALGYDARDEDAAPAVGDGPESTTRRG